MRTIRSTTIAILAIGLLAGSAVGVAAQDAARESPHGEPGLDVRELEWAPLVLDETTFGPDARLVDIAASDSMLVIGGSVGSSAAVWTSTDRMTWERVPHDKAVFGGPGDQQIKAIVPWRDGFVAAGEVGGVRDFDPRRVAVVWYSEDGEIWTRVPHDEKVFGGKGRQEMFDIAASDDRLVIVGFDEEGPCCTDRRANHDIAVWTSANGIDWKKRTLAGGEMFAVQGTPDGFFATGGGGPWKSKDGRKWDAQDTSAVGRAWLAATAANSDGLVAVGSVADGPAVWTSPDGSDWSRATIDETVRLDDGVGLVDVASSSSGLAGVAGPGYYGGDSAVLVSADGKTWEHGDTPAGIADAGLQGITALGPHFVAIGGSRFDPDAGPSIWTTFEPESALADEQSEADDVAATTSPDLLPGVDLVTEEVGPGVFRVVSDGVRDLSRAADATSRSGGPSFRDSQPEDTVPRYLGGILDGNIVAGLDGSVWWFGPGGFFRVGEEGLHSWPEELGESFQPGLADIEVASDGTVWLAFSVFGTGANLPSGISSYDGRTWTTHWQGVVLDEVAYGVEVQQDGTVWAAWASFAEPQSDENELPLDPDTSKGTVTVAHLDADGWAVLPGTLEPWPPLPSNNPVASEGGGSEVWLSDPLYGRLHRHDGEGWVVQETPDVGGVGRAAVGADGTVWVRLNAECRSNARAACTNASDIVARLEGDDWVVFGPDYGIPLMGSHYQGFEGFFAVGPDHSLWFDPVRDWESAETDCDGVANFDGEILRRYLPDHCISAMDVALDGTVWLQGGEFSGDGARPADPISTYVITPEAVVSSE